jgi:3-aminobutyryl-CoA ammonia-lyase
MAASAAHKRATNPETGDLNQGAGNFKAERAATVRLRLGPSDAGYARGLVPGARVMALFGDLETEIAINEGGDEGLLVRYDIVEFLEPLFVGDFVEGRALVSAKGNTSRKVDLELRKVIAGAADGSAEPLASPVLVATARATIVVGTRARVASASRRGEAAP